MHLSCESPLHDQHSACRSAGVTSRGSCEQVTRQGAKGLEGTEYTRLGCRRTRCRGHDGAEGTRQGAEWHGKGMKFGIVSKAFA
ncbi:unnamed protein product [Prunus armeniaca]|uniref:Uncharacterized protein n=1 Tax=Prunus armeniaca TaxID=36596 RepID=A0A6J5UV35_PRUAR|nr:unnamed protein product [Prunus armeniaca]